ncbi:hypothetical protein [Tomitella cavernea]|uniref:Uncharacterized protein n=1 Tax=Tomitella cavernea TaxID=1387982 RepID=A0ABP9DA11_9ACTN
MPSLAATLDRLIAAEKELHRELLAVLQGDAYPDMDGEVADTLSDAQLALIQVGDRLQDAVALAAAGDHD